MPWIEKFSKLGTGMQLLVIFAFSLSFVYVLGVVLSSMTVFWTEKYVIETWKKSSLETLKVQFYQLGYEKSIYFTTEFKNFMNYTKNINKVNTDIVQGKNSLAHLPPINHLTITPGLLLFTTGCYMTRFGTLSEQGQKLMDRDAEMDVIYPIVFRDYILGIYSGFTTDEILHYYPCNYTIDLTYTPIVREWFYKAVKKYPEIVISEPYIDSQSKKWVITFSKGLSDEYSKVIGANAVDITIDFLTNDIKTIKIMKTGFMLLITEGGVMVNTPSIWNSNEDSMLKIFDEKITGISESQWTEIKHKDSHDLSYIFGANGEKYLVNVHKILPYDDVDNVPLYVMLVVEENEVLEPINDIEDLFVDIWNNVIVVIVGISVFVSIFIILILKVFSAGFEKNIHIIYSMLKEVVLRSLQLSVSKDYPIGENRPNQFKEVFGALNEKISEIYDKEQKFKHFPWEKTRPHEMFYYNNWKNNLSPFNLYNQAQMRWRKVLARLTKEE